MTPDELTNHIKAVKAVARRLTLEQWAAAVRYAELQGSQLLVPRDYSTAVLTLYQRGYDDCVSWPDSKRKKGIPLVSGNGRLCWAQPVGMAMTVTPVYLARFVYYRSLDIGELPPFAEVYVITGPHWVNVPLRDIYATQLVAQHTVGKICHHDGVRKGKKYVAQRMDWV